MPFLIPSFTPAKIFDCSKMGWGRALNPTYIVLQEIKIQSTRTSVTAIPLFRMLF